MAGKDVSYRFLDALAKCVGMNAETVKQALAEINRLQQQTQALEAAVQGKPPTDHASQQPVFGTADEQVYGHVKIAHEVTNDSTDGVAVSPDAVYAYAPNRGTTPLGMVIYPEVSLIVNGEPEIESNAAAQLNGNALSVGWGNANYDGINRIDITIPNAYKYKDTGQITVYTNAGVAVYASYTNSDGVVAITRKSTSFNAYDSILILLAPVNA